MQSVNTKNSEVSKLKSTNPFLFSVEDIYFFFGLIFFRILCDISYPFVKTSFGYENPFIYDPSIFSITISWLFLLSLFPFIYRVYKTKEVASSIIFLLILFSLIPLTTLISVNQNYPLDFILAIYIYWLLLLYLAIHLPKIGLSYFINIRSKTLYAVFLFLICSSIIYLSWANTGFRFYLNIFDSMALYDLRVEARDYTTIPLIGYLVHSGDNILPILLVYFLVVRKFILAGIVATVIMLNFGITASKQVFFLLIIGLLSYLFIKRNTFQRLLLFGCISITALSILESYLFNSAITANFSTYRIFFIPAKYQAIYYDFFSLYEPDYFRQSFLRLFFESPYERSLHMILADFHNNDYFARANSGLFADAVMNLGWLGVILFPFLLVIIVNFIDSASKGLHNSVLFLIVVCLSFMLLNLNLTIAILTGGIFICIPLLYSLPRS